MDLTGRDYHAMASMGDCQTLEVAIEETVLARLVLLVEGADPADPALLHELLDSPLGDYLARIAPVMQQLDDAPEVIPLEEGGYQVGDVRVSELRGYHRRLLASVGDIRRERALLMPMTGLSASRLDELPIGHYQALVRACGFFIARLMTPRDTSTR